MVIFSWCMSVLSLFGAWLNVKKYKSCFYVWLVTNGSWTAIDIYYGVYAQAALCFSFFCISVWGILTWKGEKK